MKKTMQYFLTCGLAMILMNQLLALSGCSKIYVIKETKEARKARLEKLHAIIPPDAKPVTLVKDKAILETFNHTEGPSWLNGKLYFSNPANGLHIIDRSGSCKHLALSASCGTTPLLNGNLAVCTWRRSDDGFWSGIVELSPEGEVIGTIADSFNGKPFGNPNDVISDGRGGLYFTDPRGSAKRLPPNQPGTAVYYRNPEGTIIRVSGWDEYKFPNGILVSADGLKLFLNDDTDIVWVLDIREDGTLANKREFAHLIIAKDELKKNSNKSWSDGMKTDREGNLYVTAKTGLHIFDKNDELLGIVEFPTIPSHVVFGGDDLSILYVTAVEQVYSIQTNVKGYQYPIRRDK